MTTLGRMTDRLALKEPYSYRRDPAVPPFADDKPLIVFDGVCVLCSGFAQMVARRDRNGTFRFTAAQSPLGAALFTHYGLDPVNFETNLLIENGVAFGKMDAFAGIASRLGGLFHGAGLVRALPQPIADWIYDRIAINRYRLFGRRQACVIAGPHWRERMIG
jgi:predicted DCC family thiol-disulfide oxidoreductase YuxK